MNFTVTITFLLMLTLIAIALGSVVVWKKHEETRKRALYQNLLEQLVALEDFNLTAAVMHAKTYKIMADYRRDLVRSEKRQRFFILENIFSIERKSTLKTK